MFNLNRVLLLAGMRLGIPAAMEMMRRPQPKPISRPASRSRGYGASGSRDRLHPGRSSSVRKLQRWLNDGSIVEPAPDEQAKLRHAWYRKRKFYDALRAKMGQS